MFGKSSTKVKEKLAVVFDVGSASVGGALFSVQDQGVPKILYSVREPITLEQEVDADRFLILTMNTLEIVASKISKAGVGAPDKVFCSLSSPWYISQTRVIKLKKNTPFVFTSKLADELIKKEISIFREEHMDKYFKAGNPVRSIELKNIKTLLNGYETSTPLNQKVEEVEMIVFISMSGEEVLKKMEDTIDKHFTHKNIIFSSFAMASFTVVRDIFIHQDHFLLVDVAGEMTDISMVKKGVLRESVSFPIGRNFMIREAASLLSCSLNEAESCISLFKDGHASLETQKKVEPVISKLKREWLEKFQESLANLSSDISIPATIYLAVDEDFKDFFSQTIKTEQFS